MDDYLKAQPRIQADGFTREGDSIPDWLHLPGGNRAVARTEILPDERRRVWVRCWWFDPSKGLDGPYEVDLGMLYSGRYRDVHRSYTEKDQAPHSPDWQPRLPPRVAGLSAAP